MPLRVLHISCIEKVSYYFNNLIDFTDKNEVCFSSITFASREGFAAELEHHGVHSYALDTMNPGRYLSAAVKIWKIIGQENADIVHLHLFMPTLIGLIVAKLRGRMVVVTRHHSDALHQLKNPIKRKFYLSLERLINRYSDHIIAPSRTVRAILIEHEGMPEARVSLIPYGQTTDRFDAVQPESVERTRNNLKMTNELVLVCNSRLYERKGHVFLFEAFARLVRQGSTAVLYLVGTGAFREQLEMLTQQLAIADRVHFLGWRDDALEIMAAADIIVHPSCEDALSQALIESLMLERPVIATDISGVRDILGDGRYGVIVPPADSDALRVALEDVIAGLDEAREKARLGRRHIIEYMDAARVARAYTECYKRVIEEKAAKAAS